MGQEQKKKRVADSPRGENAFANIERIESNIEHMRGLLSSLYDHLKKELLLCNESEHPGPCMVLDVPRRLEFKANGLRYYIDFTIVASGRNDQNNVEGCIIYGVSRISRFRKCDKGDASESTIRCDRLEDKPLIQLSVNQNRMIGSTTELVGECWIEEKKDGKMTAQAKREYLDIHYRVVNHIWKDALDWTNENMLP